jgi:hypothetical protein
VHLHPLIVHYTLFSRGSKLSLWFLLACSHATLVMRWPCAACTAHSSSFSTGLSPVLQSSMGGPNANA